MGWDRGRLALGAVAAGLLVWAGVEARNLDWRALGRAPALAAPAVDPRQVEESFAGIRADLEAGRAEQALLELRQRTEHGPYPGFAWFWLGELAADEGVYTAAVRHYRRAVETDPTVADRTAAFDAGAAIDTRLSAILEGPWANQRPPEVRDLYYLRRRLGGGCE